MTTKRNFPVTIFDTEDENLAMELFCDRARKGNELAELTDYNLYKCERVDVDVDYSIKSTLIAENTRDNDENDEEY